MACRSAASSTGWTTARSPPRSRRGGRCDPRVMSGDTLAVLAVALAASWASGINTYAAVLVLGAAQRLGFVTLPHDLQVLGSVWVLAAAALLLAIAHPIAFLCLLALFVVALLWLLPKLVRLALLPFRRMARRRQPP